MKVLTSIYGLTVPRIQVELIECDVDPANSYGQLDWYLVRYHNGDTTYVPGSELDLIVIVDDQSSFTTQP